MDEPNTSSVNQSDYFRVPKDRIYFHTRYEADFPNEGVVNRFGYLFHHFLPFRLESQHIERLLEYGVQYKFKERFTKEEDDKIRKNWRKFAEKHNLIYEDARLYVGFQVPNGSIPRSQRNRNDKHVTQGMWPYLCRKLENRSALQVQRRMCTIFDPHWVGRDEPIPLNYVIEIVMRMKEGEDPGTLGEEFGYPYARVQRALKEFKMEVKYQGYTIEDVIENPSILEIRQFPKKDYFRLYHTVLHSLKVSDAFIRKIIISERLKWKELMKKEMKDFNWVTLIPKFCRQNEKSLKEAWYTMLAEVYEAFWIEISENFLGQEQKASIVAKEEAFEAAKNKIIQRPILSLPVVRDYARALSKSTTNVHTFVSNLSINFQKLKRRLIKYNIINKEEYDIIQCPVYKKICKLIRKWSNELFKHIDFPIGLKDKLKILEHCYKQLIQKHGENPEQLSLPGVSQVLLVETTIRILYDISGGDWSPPAFLQNWIRNSEFLDYFDYQKPGRIRDEEKELHLFRKTVFTDSKHLYVPKVERVVGIKWKHFQEKFSQVEQAEMTNEEEEGEIPSASYEIQMRQDSSQDIFADTPDESQSTNEANNLSQTPMETPLPLKYSFDMPTAFKRKQEPVNPGSFKRVGKLFDTKNNNETIRTEAEATVYLESFDQEFQDDTNPVVKKLRFTDDFGDEEEQDEQNEDAGFSHLIIQDVPTSRKKKNLSSSAPINTDWLSVFN